MALHCDFSYLIDVFIIEDQVLPLHNLLGRGS